MKPQSTWSNETIQSLNVLKSRFSEVSHAPLRFHLRKSSKPSIPTWYKCISPFQFHVAWRDFRVTASLIVFSELLSIWMLRNILSRSCYENQRIFMISRFYARILQFVPTETTDQRLKFLRVRLHRFPIIKQAKNWRFCFQFLCSPTNFFQAFSSSFRRYSSLTKANKFPVESGRVSWTNHGWSFFLAA